MSTARKQAMRVLARGLTSPAAVAIARSGARLIGRRHELTWYHRVDDPHSQLLAMLLPELLRDFRGTVRCVTVRSAGQPWIAEPALQDEWALKDSKLYASLWGLSCAWKAPPRNASRAAERALEGLGGGDYLRAARRVGTELWSGALDDAPPARVSDSVEAATRRALREGRYNSALLCFEGQQWHGPSRLEALAASLQDLGAGRLPPRCDLPQVGGDTSVIVIYLSIRSPYSYLAITQLIDLAAVQGLRLEVRPVLPMVMRGLEVPLKKRIALVQDAAREARALGISFGNILDPVGSGVERALACFPLARAHGVEADWIRRCSEAAFARGIDLASRRGLLRVANECGLPGAEVVAALRDPTWRAEVEANERSLRSLGHWGVPTFQRGDFHSWGQDRLWQLLPHFPRSPLPAPLPARR